MVPSDDTGSTGRAGRGDVELRLPADGAYASVLRTTAAAIAARLDFTMEDIEDLRIAVAEAGALVLPAAAPDGDVVARFHVGRGTLAVELETPAPHEPAPDVGSFGWQVLDTLADEVSAGTECGVFRVGFSLTAQTAPPETTPPPPTAPPPSAPPPPAPGATGAAD